MNVSEITIEQANITLVYDGLDISVLSRDRLRTILPKTVPQLIDLQQVLTLLYPALGLACVVEGRRIRCNDGSQRQVGDRPLAMMARRAHEVVTEGAKLAAFGVNFDISGSFQGVDNVREYLTERFISSPSELQECLGATDMAAVPHLIFRIDPAEYTLRLESSREEASSFRASLNVHFKKDRLPSSSALESLLIQEHKRFIDSILGGL